MYSLLKNLTKLIKFIVLCYLIVFRQFFYRSEPRRNSYSSDSISRKYRGDRKKQNVRRNGENLKTNKATKGRVVQVNIQILIISISYCYFQSTF